VAATNPNRSQALSGQDALDASLPLSDTVRGIMGSQGAQPGLRKLALDKVLGVPDAQSPSPEGRDFTGLGEMLEAPDAIAYRSTDDLVQRQEIPAISRLHQDRHWKNIKLGYTWSSLEKVQDQNRYRQAFPPGSESLRPSAVPNKAADLCNKLVEVLNTDPPLPSPKATDDSEEAERATELAAQFLKEDGGEQGTDDESLFWVQTDLATTSSSAYLHLWTDKQGGGWVPSEIKAHPQAVDANNPLIGPDGQPTTDYILRYVTEPDEAGMIQFTDDPSKAGRTWLPKIRVEKWAREHWRFYPEDKSVNQCDAMIGLLYCTLDEARRRWPDTVGQLGEQELGELCDWTPNRYMVLLPPALRSRWKMTTGATTDPKGSSNDQRILFYYAHYRVPSPNYPEGMVLFVNGAMDGFVLERDTLSCRVQVPSQSAQDQEVEETHLMEPPLVAIRLLQDAEEGDPTGKAFMARIGAASEAQATLATSYLEAMDKILHPARFATATSPVEAWQVEESRGTGDFVPVLSKEDFPFYEPAPTLPNSFFPMVEWQTEQLNSIASLPKPLQGSDGQQEVSGVARRIAVGQAQISLSRMSAAVQAARKRFWRLKLQLAMKHFSVPQLLKFVGEDGAYKQEWFTGVNFAHVTSVDMQAGTGTMMPPQEKVTYLSQMAQLQFLTPAEASEAARPTFTQTLGVPADPQQQRIERQVSSWLEGPPDGWLEQAQQRAMESPKVSTPDQPPVPAQSSPVAPTPNMGPTGTSPVVPLWTPFAPLAPDDEPPVATIRLNRLRRLIGTVRFGSQPKEWQKVALDEYSRMRKAVADAAGAQQKAEVENAKAVEQIKSQATVEAAKMQAQVTAEAKKQDAQIDLQIEQQKVQNQSQLDAERQRVELQLEAQRQQQELAAEEARAQIDQQFELMLERMKQEFELQKIQLEAALDLKAQEKAAVASQKLADSKPEPTAGGDDD
jgi:hypothetical protein